MTDAEYVVIIKVKRKSKGGNRDGRHGSTGKVGVVFRLEKGRRVEEVFRVEGATFKHVSRELHNPGPVPNSVTINSRKETYF
jgi:hypothetical protein